MADKDLEQTLVTILHKTHEYGRSSEKYAKDLKKTYTDMGDKLISQLKELGGTLSTSYEKNKPVNAAGVYKDMINQLSAINESVKSKPVPVWNWPQYASVGVRDKNFSNVNPATEESNQWGSGYQNQKVSIVGTIAYIAAAAPGTATTTAAWQASKIDFTDLTNITIKWAGGSQDFVNVATNLAALSYS